MAIRKFQNYIGGEWVDAHSGKTFENLNPADTRDVVGIFPDSGKEDVDRAVAAAQHAFNAWRLTPAPHRAEILYRAGQILIERKEHYSQEMTREMGKVLKETRGDVQEAIDTAFIWRVKADGSSAKPRHPSCLTSSPCQSACRWACVA